MSMKMKCVARLNASTLAAGACPPKKYRNWMITKAAKSSATLPSTMADSVKPRKGFTDGSPLPLGFSSLLCEAACRKTPANRYAPIRM